MKTTYKLQAQMTREPEKVFAEQNLFAVPVRISMIHRRPVQSPRCSPPFSWASWANTFQAESSDQKRRIFRYLAWCGPDCVRCIFC